VSERPADRAFRLWRIRRVLALDRRRARYEIDRPRPFHWLTDKWPPAPHSAISVIALNFYLRR
jgi:hypothetical protein